MAALAAYDVEHLSPDRLGHARARAAAPAFE